MGGRRQSSYIQSLLIAVVAEQASPHHCPPGLGLVLAKKTHWDRLFIACCLSQAFWLLGLSALLYSTQMTTAGVEFRWSDVYVPATFGSRSLSPPGSLGYTSFFPLLRVDLPVVEAIPSEAAAIPTILRMARNTRSRKRYTAHTLGAQ